MASYVRSPELMDRQRSRLLIVDVQDKFRSVIWQYERMLHQCVKLVRGAQILSVPQFVTEQYPQGLGTTDRELAALLPPPIEKNRFSCAECLNWGTAAEQSDGRTQVVVAGIESHVCVLQTCFDLLSDGFRVFVPADAVSSRFESNYHAALNRLANAGCVITSTESVLFEWCETSGTPEFKRIAGLVR